MLAAAFAVLLHAAAVVGGAVAGALVLLLREDGERLDELRLRREQLRVRAHRADNAAVAAGIDKELGLFGHRLSLQRGGDQEAREKAEATHVAIPE